jgi:predicted DNA-binding WGR domain protein
MKKVAHQPHMNIKMGEKLITPRSYQEGMAKMLHFIDAAKNHSKFYEMAIIPGDNGGFKLIKMYGALTDPNTTARKPPRINTLVENHPTLASAIKSMEKKYREELRDGYTDTFLKNRGQYPIGLTRTVGFGWGTQDATESSDAIPALRKLIVKLDAAIDAGDRMDTDDMSVSMAEVSRILFDMPASSMATELQRKLSTPAKQLLSGEVNPKLLSRALKVVRNYLENQLSAIGRMASARSALVKLAASLPAGSRERKVILASLEAEIKKDADPKSHNQNKPETYYGKKASGGVNIPSKHIFGNAKVFESAKVSGKAEVSGNARVFGDAEVYEKAKVYGDANVSGKTYVYYNAKVYGDANVSGYAEVHGDAHVYGNAKVYGDANVHGDAKIFGNARIGGDAEIFDGEWDGSEGEITSGRWKAPGVPA